MATTDTTPFTILTPKEAADRLRISAAMVYKLSQLGQLPSVRIGRRIGILESDLNKFVEVSRYPQPRALPNVR
ncbi:MAG: helix-turn-helix domain-containing protein [Chloroflexi bacterium]|nr:helix-turn-helix domain-containing protein [Chloroflexota bacterium]